MPRGKVKAFTDWVGNLFRGNQAMPKDAYEASQSALDLKGRLQQRFEMMMQEVDKLSSENYSAEEHVEYGFISLVRFALPFVFFLAFGYEDGLFMTGFRDFTLRVSSVIVMYVIGYALEALRTSLVYSMSFSRAEGRMRAFRQQFAFWIVLSLGCGVAQLASALVIQALGSDKAIVGDTALAEGAKVIMGRMPWLIYLAVGIRVVLCAIADWTCAGFLHRKRKTVEQKVAEITTRAANVGTLVQASINSDMMLDNAQQYQEMVRGNAEELKAIREQQQTIYNFVLEAGKRQMYRIREIPSGEGSQDE
jgi:hypothetical protein